ncbi:MAG: XdhC family protein [Candidatus Rokubacteria bacterium]|nr:XdhC family protein [Candidatus Rokubacteria bacterium]
MAEDLLALAHDLAARREAFALATVVRAERPTSAKPGAKAIIRTDGSLTGWIGGSCAEPIVRVEALAALRDGQPRLIALLGEGTTHVGREGVREFPMTCHSGGTLEVYIKPVPPRPALILVGGGPVVEALARLGEGAGFLVVVTEGTPAVPAESSVVVATHGRFDEDALAHALSGEAGYVSLVASPKRARAVREALLARGLPEEALGRLKAPAGLDLGAVTPEEIAVSILAEIIRVRRAQPPAASAAPRVAAAVAPAPAVARDPICGMAVTLATARHVAAVAGRRFYFCGAGCQRAFELDPARHVGVVER